MIPANCDAHLAESIFQTRSSVKTYTNKKRNISQE
ncbi:MAG: DUF6783 domain-containing protein [Anaerobutyricum hallii]